LLARDAIGFEHPGHTFGIESRPAVFPLKSLRVITRLQLKHCDFDIGNMLLL